MSKDFRLELFETHNDYVERLEEAIKEIKSYPRYRDTNAAVRTLRGFIKNVTDNYESYLTEMNSIKDDGSMGTHGYQKRQSLFTNFLLEVLNPIDETLDDMLETFRTRAAAPAPAPAAPEPESDLVSKSVSEIRPKTRIVFPPSRLGKGKSHLNNRMPYKLRKAPKRNLYWVVGADGTKHSKEPIPKERAEAQMRALYAAETKEGGGNDKLSALAKAVFIQRERRRNDAARIKAGYPPKGDYNVEKLEEHIRLTDKLKEPRVPKKPHQIKEVLDREKLVEDETRKSREKHSERNSPDYSRLRELAELAAAEPAPDYSGERELAGLFAAEPAPDITERPSAIIFRRRGRGKKGSGNDTQSVLVRTANKKRALERLGRVVPPIREIFNREGYIYDKRHPPLRREKAARRLPSPFLQEHLRDERARKEAREEAERLAGLDGSGKKGGVKPIDEALKRRFLAKDPTLTEKEKTYIAAELEKDKRLAALLKPAVPPRSVTKPYPPMTATEIKIANLIHGLANQFGTQRRMRAYAASKHPRSYGITLRHGDDRTEVVGLPRSAPEAEGARGTYKARGRPLKKKALRGGVKTIDYPDEWRVTIDFDPSVAPSYHWRIHNPDNEVVKDDWADTEEEAENEAADEILAYLPPEEGSDMEDAEVIQQIPSESDSDMEDEGGGKRGGANTRRILRGLRQIIDDSDEDVDIPLDAMNRLLGIIDTGLAEISAMPRRTLYQSLTQLDSPEQARKDAIVNRVIDDVHTEAKRIPLEGKGDIKYGRRFYDYLMYKFHGEGLEHHSTRNEINNYLQEEYDFIPIHEMGDWPTDTVEIVNPMMTTGSGGISIPKKAFVKEHKNLIRVLKRGKKSELLKEAKDQSEELKGMGPIPDRNTLQQLATQSYEDVPSNRIGQLELVRATPTLKFYKDNGNTIVVAIRGTKPTDMDDVKADGLIAIGQLESSDRYKRDLTTIQQFQTQYPPSQYDYYGVGHSLGGAILDMFLKRGFLKNGVSYNPAVQPQDFQNTSLANQRVYMESDPLYALMGRNLAKKPETRAPRKKSWWESAASIIPYVGTAMKGYDLYQSHKLDQFQGGAKAHSKFEKQLKKIGIEPSSYLKEAQRRAKDAGLPYKLLGFAADGTHKLAIPDAAGRMIMFGRVGYGDHLTWSHLEQSKKVPMGTADAKRNTFHKSHSAIKGDWKKNPFSPNNLALKVLW